MKGNDGYDDMSGMNVNVIRLSIISHTINGEGNIDVNTFRDREDVIAWSEVSATQGGESTRLPVDSEVSFQIYPRGILSLQVRCLKN